MRSLKKRAVLPFAIALAASFASSAFADGTPLRADLIDPKTVKLDGVLKEWAELTPLSFALKGNAGKPDLEAKAVVAYDATNVYVAADVTDDVFRPGGDHLVLVLGFPGGTTHEVQIFPGEPGKSPGRAKSKDGAPIAGAKVVEAPQQGGWTVEASIPWSTFPESRLLRVGLRGGIFVHDADSGTTVKNIVGTASSTAYANLPPLSMEAEQSAAEGLRDKQVHSAPKCNLMANVVGDETKERVLVFEHYLIVLGPNYRKGTEYYWSDLNAEVLSCEARDVNGDGLADILLRKRITTGGKSRDVLQILSFGSSDAPSPIFEHEIGVATEAGSVANEVAFSADGGKVAIRVTPGTAKGLSAANYREPTETSWDPVLLPWSTVASQTYKVSGGRYAKASEERKEGVAAPPAAAAAVQPGEASLPKPPPPPSSAELQEKVYDLYKKDRNVSGRPRFDLAIDVAGDKQTERVLVHDRDIVVFGKGFKGGTGYSYTTLSQFASPSDILELTARDVTGDGKAEIIVRGVLHGNAPPQAGGGTVDREVVVVFTVVDTSLKRIFAAETARSMGKKRVEEKLALSGNAIQISPGRASEWTEKTYPFNQDTSPVGGLEPMLLPWASGTVRYRWTGTEFTK